MQNGKGFSDVKCIVTDRIVFFLGKIIPTFSKRSAQRVFRQSVYRLAVPSCAMLTRLLALWPHAPHAPRGTAVPGMLSSAAWSSAVRFKSGLSGNHTCAECGFVAASSYQLAEHAAIHDKPYACALCSKSYGSVVALERHVAYSHASESVHKCSSCGWATNSRGAMQAHRAKCGQ